MSKNRKLIILLLSGAILILLPYLFGIFPEGSTAKTTEENAPFKDTFPVIHPVVMDTVYLIDYIAEIHAMQHIELKAKSGGYLEKIHVDEGQAVKKGQLLFSIGSQGYEAELLKATSALRSAVAEAKTAEVELKNVKELVAKKVVSTTEQEMAEAKLEALEAKVEEARSHEASARLNFTYTQVRAPFDGIIGRIPNKVGSLLEDGAFITSISDNSQVYAYFNVSERDYLNLTGTTNGEQVELIMANNKPFPHPGKIESVDSKIDRGTGNIAFRATFPNPDHLLKHGATGKVQITKILKNAMIIPQKATVESQDQLYVFVLDKDNNVERRTITTQLRLPKLYVMESGLSPTDRIIYEGTQLIKEGDHVTIELVTFLPGSSIEKGSMSNVAGATL